MVAQLLRLCTALVVDNQADFRLPCILQNFVDIHKSTGQSSEPHFSYKLSYIVVVTIAFCFVDFRYCESRLVPLQYLQVPFRVATGCTMSDDEESRFRKSHDALHLSWKTLLPSSKVSKSSN